MLQRNHWLIATGMLGALVFGARQWHGWRSTLDHSRDQRRTLLTEAERDTAGFELVEESHRTARTSLLRSRSRLLPAEETASAQAEMAMRLRYLAGRHGAALTRVASLADSAWAPLAARASLELELETDTRGLLKLIGEMGTDSFALELRSLRVTVINPDASEYEPERLRVVAIASGWYPERRDAP